MSDKRREGACSLGKGPGGLNLCFCGCGREVVRPRLNWFSGACISAWKLRNDPATIRRAVFRRDRGICAICSCDCEAEAAKQRATITEWRDIARTAAEKHFEAGMLPEPPPYGPGEPRPQGEPWIWYWTDHWLKERVQSVKWTPYGHAWEADHIVPVVEGGGQCGLDGYRTLCLKCHKVETAKLRKRIAERRRAGAD
jgi:5-methylcytosine-specific restriction endonuclease McrA